MRRQMRRWLACMADLRRPNASPASPQAAHGQYEACLAIIHRDRPSRASNNIAEGDTMQPRRASHTRLRNAVRNPLGALG